MHVSCHVQAFYLGIVLELDAGKAPIFSQCAETTLRTVLRQTANEVKRPLRETKFELRSMSSPSALLQFANQPNVLLA